MGSLGRATVAAVTSGRAPFSTEKKQQFRRAEQENDDTDNENPVRVEHQQQQQQQQQQQLGH